MTSINANNDEKNRKNYEKVVRIYNAIRDHKSSVQYVRSLLQTEGDINYRLYGSNQVTSLLHAVSSQFENGTRLAILNELLLDYGADFTIKDKTGRTVVHRVIQEQADGWRKLLSRRTFQNEFIDAVLAAHVKFDNPSNPSDENGISHFHAACMTNNAAAVEFFLENGVEVNQAVSADSPFFPGHTPLQLAVKYTCPDVVEVLLKYGANLCTKNVNGLTPLHSIIERVISMCDITETPEFIKTLSILSKFVIDKELGGVNATDDYGFSKLHVACLLGDQSSVENILTQVANVNQAVNFDSPVCPGYSALHFAAFSNLQIFKILLQNGANIEAKNEKGQTPFELCLQNYSVKDIHSVLLSIAEWRNVVLSDNETKLMDVVSAIENVDDFISFSKNVTSAPTVFIPFDSPLWPGYTLLHLAVIFAKKFYYRNKWSRVSFFMQKEDTNVIDECLKQGGDMTVVDARGSTALHLAFHMQKRDVIQRILDHHDSVVNPVDKNNLSHFHIACATRHLKAVEHFLSNNVDVNVPVSSAFDWYTRARTDGSRHFAICSGSTAVHISVACGDDDITRTLLKYGADVNAKDANGLTPVHRLFACRDYRANADVQKLLLSAEHLKDVTIDCGLSHFHVACFFSHCEAVEKLLEDGADATAPVIYKTNSRVKDYDEFFCNENGSNHESLYFLSENVGYTPLDFLWRPRRRRDEFDAKSFWKISFMLIERHEDVFAKTDNGTARLQSLLRNIHCHGNNSLYALLDKNTATQALLEEEFGVTKLHLACNRADVETVESEIKRGANVKAKVHSNSPVWQGFTPLHFIVKTKNLDRMQETIRLLMMQGANPFLADDCNETPFHVIKQVWYDNYNQADELLQVFTAIKCMFNSTKKFEVNPTDDEGISVFHIACANQNVAAVQQFLSHGVDVNLPTSDFSDFSRSCTPLHFLLKYHYGLHERSFTCDTCDENFSKVLDMLMQRGANVNATFGAVFCKILPFKAVEMEKSRRILIEKLIRYTPDNITPLELLLRQRDACPKNAHLFTDATYQLYGFTPCNWGGYGYGEGKIMETQNFIGILSYSMMTKIDEAGRNLIHSIVSIKSICTPDVEFNKRTVSGNKIKKWSKPKPTRRPYVIPHDFYMKFYEGIIERLSIGGCDINHQDNEGKTALHLAVASKNNRVIVPLLKNGVDINVIDESGKTAFSYCEEAYTPRIRFTDDCRYYYKDDYYANKILAIHVYKLEFCGQRVSDQNKQLQRDTLEALGPIAEETLNCFHEEVEKTKTITIGLTTSSLYDFLTNADAEIVYINTMSEECWEMDQFFTIIDQHKFDQIDCLLKLKYRQTIERTKLIGVALESLNCVVKCQLPYLCGRYILKFLNNEDLKHLIASAS